MKRTKSFFAVITMLLAFASLTFGATSFATQNTGGTGAVVVSGVSAVSELDAWLNQVDQLDNEGTVTFVTGPMLAGGTLAVTGAAGGTLNATFDNNGSVLYVVGNGVVYPNGTAKPLGAPAGQLFVGTFNAPLTWTVYYTPTQYYAVLAGTFSGTLKGKGAVTGTSKQLYFTDVNGNWYLVGGNISYTN